LPKKHDFAEKLSEVQEWEKKLGQTIVDLVVAETWRQATRMEQREGIDTIVKLKEGKFDVKIRDRKWYLRDILIETVSVVEKNIPGWFYTSDADAVFYVWWNETKTDLMPIGYFIFIQNKKFREWFEKNKNKYRELQTETKSEWGSWHTKFVVIPIEDFPKGSLMRVRVSVPPDTEQSTLERFST